MIPLIHCLVLKVIPLKLEDSVATELYSLVLTEIDKRMGVTESVSPLAIATILDPKLKKCIIRMRLFALRLWTKLKNI